MYKIQTLNKIAAVGLEQLESDYTISDSERSPDGIILRSFNMHDSELPENLKAIARAGAGVNNIPIDKCSERGIVVFNTPGANANAVKELVLAGLFLSSRKIYDGITWAKGLSGEDVPKQVEKGKGAFVGPEIMGKTLGVVGLGAIGVMVANAADALGMEVKGFDPFISVEAAWGLSSNIKKATHLKELFETCDYITLHIPLNKDTKGLLGAESLGQMKDGVRILNFSRGDLVEDDAMLEALASGKVAAYVTDFPCEKLLNASGVIPIPHLGASTPESEDNCAKMAVSELKEFLENGNIINSVNYPSCFMEHTDNVRVCVTHENIPNILGPVSSVFAGKGINISNMLNKSKENNAYTMVDAERVDEDCIAQIKAIGGVHTVRVIR